MKKLILIVLGTAITIIAIPVILALLLVVSSGISKAFQDYELRDMPNETDTFPAYVDYGTLYTEKGKVNVAGICRDQHEDASVKEIFCVADGKAVFVYTQPKAWILASVDLESKEYQELTRFENTATYYRRNIYGEYSERNGYFRDGEIVLSDGETVFSYDVSTGQTQTCAASGYTFPQRTIYGECTADKTLNLHIDDSVYSFTLDDLAAGSEGLAKIVALKDKKNWNKTSYLAGFMLFDTVRTDGERIYCVTAILDYLGSPHAVILEYDREQGVWQYVTKIFCGDDTYGNCYVIPTVCEE